jgi:hypothetical protein
MSRMEGLKRAAVAGAMVAAAATLAGCGKQGVLEQPAPLFGAKAKAEYQARKAQEAADDAQRAAQRPATSSSTPSTTSTGNDNAPLSTRNIQDPNQKLSPLSSSPIQGAPNPLGPPVNPR